MKNLPIGHDGSEGPGSRIGACCCAGLLALALLPAFWPDTAAAHTCDDPFSTDLIAGRTIDAGDVKVCNDDTMLTVTYEATFPWCLLETDLHVATVPDPPADPDANIPQNRPGNPKPDEFAYGDEYGGCLDGPAIFEIPLDEIDGGVDPDEAVVIAAHAVVEDFERKEGAWGDGTRFVERGNWATFFTYEVQSPSCDQPEGSCTVFVTSGTFTGDLVSEADALGLQAPDGLAAGDAICQHFAESEGSSAAPGTYKAWLSAGGVGNSAAQRLTQADVPYRLVDEDETLVANDFDDLTTCEFDGPFLVCLSHPIDLTELDDPAGDWAWTGTSEAGAASSPEFGDILNCGAWSLIAGVDGHLGATGSRNRQWTFDHESSVQCAIRAGLYCFQQ